MCRDRQNNSAASASRIVSRHCQPLSHTLGRHHPCGWCTLSTTLRVACTLRVPHSVSRPCFLFVHPLHHPQLDQVLVIESNPVTHASVLRHSSLNPLCLCSRSTACSHSASIRYNCPSRLCQCATSSHTLPKVTPEARKIQTHSVLVPDLLSHSKQVAQNTKTSPSTLRYGHHGFPGGNLTSVNHRLSRTAHFQRNRTQSRARAVTNFPGAPQAIKAQAQAQGPSLKTGRIV